MTDRRHEARMRRLEAEREKRNSPLWELTHPPDSPPQPESESPKKLRRVRGSTEAERAAESPPPVGATKLCKCGHTYARHRHSFSPVCFECRTKDVYHVFEPEPVVSGEDLGANQCDGCNAGIPLRDGKHRMGTGVYPDWMMCQRVRYEPESPPPVGAPMRSTAARTLSARCLAGAHATPERAWKQNCWGLRRSNVTSGSMVACECTCHAFPRSPTSGLDEGHYCDLCKHVLPFHEPTCPIQARPGASVEGLKRGPRAGRYVPCQRCGADYSVDFVVSDEMWERISGNAHGEGMLCLWCMDDLADEKGIETTVRVYFVLKALRSEMYEDQASPPTSSAPNIEESK